MERNIACKEREKKEKLSTWTKCYIFDDDDDDTNDNNNNDTNYDDSGFY